MQFPYLEVEGSSLFESNAICRYFGNLSPEKGLNGKSKIECNSTILIIQLPKLTNGLTTSLSM